MWQGSGSTNTWNLSYRNPRVVVVLLQLSWILTEGGLDSVVTLDTTVGKSRKKVADRVTRSPTRLCSRDGKLCYYRRLEYDFCFFALLASFVLFLLPYPGMFLFVLLRPCSSHTALQQVRVFLAAFFLYSCVIVFCLISGFLLFFLFCFS